MRSTLLAVFLSSLICFCAASFSASWIPAEADRVNLAEEPQPRPSPATAPVPGFVPNKGQWDSSVTFGLWAGDTATAFRADGWIVGCPTTDPDAGWAVGFTFQGTDSMGDQEGVNEKRGRVNFFSAGRDPVLRVPTYEKLVMSGTYPGVDLEASISDGNLRYDLLLEPGADLDQVEVRVDGCSRLSVDEVGDLMVTTPAGVLRQTAPVAWQRDLRGEDIPVACHFRLLGDDRFGFSAPAIDPSLPLTVDPGIVWSLRAGGYSAGDMANDVAIGANGDVFLTGSGPSDFPTTPGAFSQTGTGAYVARISANGSYLLASTFIGGQQAEGRAVAVDGNDVIVAGVTGSGFPATSGTLAATPRGATDGFVARFDGSLANLVAATYVGGGGPDEIYGMSRDPASGDILVCGQTYSIDLPVTPNASQPSLVGGYDAFAAILAPALDQVQYCTFIAGLSNDRALDIAAGPTGDAFVVGYTESQNFLTTGSALIPSHPGGNRNGWVARFNPSGGPGAGSRVYMTYLGGTAEDQAEAVAVTSMGSAVVVGKTNSIDFPTTGNTFSPGHNGQPPVGLAAAGYDGFIARLSPTGGWLERSTFIGGNSNDWVKDVALDPSGMIYVAGITSSANFPTTPGALAELPYSSSDSFVARLDPNAGSVLYGTYLGGNSTDDCTAISLAPSGDVVVTGITGSSTFPVSPGSASTPFNNACVIVFGLPLPCPDLFLTRLELLPDQAQLVGSASGPAPAPPHLSLAGTIQSPGPDARLIMSGAPPMGPGILGIGFPAAPGGISTAGITVYVDLAQPWYQFNLNAGATGYAELAMPIPPGISGLSFMIQAAWQGTSTWGVAGAMAATPGLLVNIP